jgi:hypothetical protein
MTVQLSEFFHLFRLQNNVLRFVVMRTKHYSMIAVFGAASFHVCKFQRVDIPLCLLPVMAVYGIITERKIRMTRSA